MCVPRIGHLPLPPLGVEAVSHTVFEEVQEQDDHYDIAIMVICGLADCGDSLASHDLMTLPVSGCSS